MYRSGNVLFLILLAVALFAALSYAVTQSSRSGGNDISDEDARLAASQIVQYATMIEQTIARLILSNGCREQQISFAADSDGDGNWYDSGDNYHNPNSPSDLSCHVFHVNGGNIPSSPPKQDWQDAGLAASNDSPYVGIIGEYYFTARLCFPQIGLGLDPCWNDGENNAELILALPWLNERICGSLNKLVLGSESIPAASGYTLHHPQHAHRFNGEYLSVGKRNGPNEAEVIGKSSFCFEDADISSHPGDGYHYYHVLIPR